MNAEYPLLKFDHSRDIYRMLRFVDLARFDECDLGSCDLALKTRGRDAQLGFNRHTPNALVDKLVRCLTCAKNKL